MLVIHFPYGNCMSSIFFLTKNFSFLFSTFHQNLCQNKRKVLRKFDDTILAKCMKFVWLVFFHRLSLWNCMTSIFGLWRSTRVFSFQLLQKYFKVSLVQGPTIFDRKFNIRKLCKAFQIVFKC